MQRWVSVVATESEAVSEIGAAAVEVLNEIWSVSWVVNTT